MDKDLQGKTPAFPLLEIDERVQFSLGRAYVLNGLRASPLKVEICSKSLMDKDLQRKLLVVKV